MRGPRTPARVPFSSDRAVNVDVVPRLKKLWHTQGPREAGRLDLEQHREGDEDGELRLTFHNRGDMSIQLLLQVLPACSISRGKTRNRTAGFRWILFWLVQRK